MKLSFRVNYNTHWEQQLYVIGSIPELGALDIEKAFPMTYLDNGDWVAELKIPQDNLSFEYQYVLKDKNQNIIREVGENRIVEIENKKEVVFNDVWRIEEKQNVFCSSAFKDNLMKHASAASGSRQDYEHTMVFRIKVPRVPSNCVVALLGNQPALGNWQADKALLMSLSKCALWTVQIDASKLTYPLEYKYAIYNLETRNIVSWEYGVNRYFPPLEDGKKKMTIRTDEHFRFEIPNWKGAGLAIPVFSLRTKNGFGVGEFLDLKKMIDWAKITGQKLIQTLPINDTSITGTNSDSYPYNAISVFALHPIYANIEQIAKKENLVLPDEYEKDKKYLNKKSYVEYAEVNELKWKYLDVLYQQAKSQLKNDKGFQRFFSENEHWLLPYAVFCYLKEKNGTADFKTWTDYKVFDIKNTQEIATKEYDTIAIYYFIQYHLHLQLSEVKQYALENSVVLKGDIPIGISPLSVEAWMEPHLFNIHSSAGAPPDDFSQIGQNWGFPTYNWHEMEKNNYAWWKNRFSKLATYFDAYRIDHILGFFRIWEIPIHAVWGLLGTFNPALPLTKEEIESYGIVFDEKRFLEPYITNELLNQTFLQDTEFVKKTFLLETEHHQYKFKPEFDTQKKIEAYFASQEKSLRMLEMLENLYNLHCEVLFIRDPREINKFHPRISIFLSHTFQTLDHQTKTNLDRLYVEYYYHRHNQFWKEQAMKKLPALISCTNMMVCGEDLGMIPDSVPEVMNELQILSLEIERMPKNPEVEFTRLKNIPYMSVCTTSTHDMSTIRGWWEEDREKTQRYYNQVLKLHGIAPLECDANICKNIIDKHLSSPAIWTILPLQDWLSINEEIRSKDVHQERINIPSNPKHFWCYRMHLNVEDLIQQKKLNQAIADMIKKSDRDIQL